MKKCPSQTNTFFKRLIEPLPAQLIRQFPERVQKAIQLLPENTEQGAFADFKLIKPIINVEEALKWLKNVSDYDSIDDTLRALGWHELSCRRGLFYGFSGDQKVADLYARLYTILKLRLAAPKSQYGYHGTIWENLNSLKNQGLNNSLGVSSIDNSNFYRLGPKKKVSLTTDLDYAFTFAEEGKGLVLRTKLAKALPKESLIADDEVIPPQKLEVSSDGGKSWSPLLDFTPKPQ